jgi:transposase
MRPRGSAEELERRRRLAIQRLREGYRPIEIARFLGVTDRSVRGWARMYRRHGKKGLRAIPVMGRPSKLTRTQQKIALRWLKDDPQEHGFPTELWTAARLAQLIWEEFDVRLNPDYLATWLRARGRTPQIPQKVPRERDEIAIAKWIRKDWKHIKKSQTKGRPYRNYRRERSDDGSLGQADLGSARAHANTTA